MSSLASMYTVALSKIAPTYGVFLTDRCITLVGSYSYTSTWIVSFVGRCGRTSIVSSGLQCKVASKVVVARVGARVAFNFSLLQKIIYTQTRALVRKLLVSCHSGRAHYRANRYRLKSWWTL